MACETPEWISDIDGPAREIVLSQELRIRVAAGPGTGKTYAMQKRVELLLSRGVAPDQILAVTFTRAAANSLRRKLQSAGSTGCDHVASTTFHAYCFSILGSADTFRQLQRSARPLMSFERAYAIADLRLPDRKKAECKELLREFEAAWSKLQSDEPGWPNDLTAKTFHRDLMSWLREHEAILLAELVTLALHYLRENPHAKEFERFKYVLVDEYQDLNKADQTLIDFIARDASLIVIGDADQSIYSSLRYAHPEGISDFSSRHGQVADFHLETSRRCPSKVIDAANNLIANNTDRTSRFLTPYDRTHVGSIDHILWKTWERESDGIGKLIKARIDSGSLTAGDVMVLAPRRDSGYRIRDGLVNLGVVARSYYREEALGNQEAQEAYTMLTLLARPSDRVALRCWLGLGHSDDAVIQYRRLLDESRQRQLKLRDSLNELLLADARPTALAHVVGRYEKLVVVEREVQGASLRDIVDILCPEVSTSVADLRAVLLSILEQNDERSLSLLELHESLRDSLVNSEPPENPDFVRVMSLQSSKGLDAPLVIIAGCIEGWIPRYDQKLPNWTDELEEQRRLLYVAITRASQDLVISRFESMPTKLAKNTGAKNVTFKNHRAHVHGSQFLRELGGVLPKPSVMNW